MKTKECKKCGLCQDISLFTSTRAKYCKTCHEINRKDQIMAMQKRAIEKLKTKKQKTQGIIRISDLKKKAQKVFNAWIRNRDKDLPCISCGKYVDKYEAGHYIAQGLSGFLRYEPLNVNNQCTACNRWKHGNLIEYRIGLIKKIGEPDIKWLEDMRYKVKKWTREELEEIIERYKL